jgi:hypothetical protein
VANLIAVARKHAPQSPDVVADARGEPPVGPAMPVTATLVATSKRRRAPAAIARTVSSDTAPWTWSTSAGTSSSVRFTPSS